MAVSKKQCSGRVATGPGSVGCVAAGLEECHRGVTPVRRRSQAGREVTELPDGKSGPECESSEVVDPQ